MKNVVYENGQRVVYHNPTPIVSAMVPVRLANGETGLLALRRGKREDIGYGKLDLPGGYLEVKDRDINRAMRREVFEETGVELNRRKFSYNLKYSMSAGGTHLTLFVYYTEPVPIEDIDLHFEGDETMEVVVLTDIPPRYALAFNSRYFKVKEFFENGCVWIP